MNAMKTILSFLLSGLGLLFLLPACSSEEIETPESDVNPAGPRVYCMRFEAACSDFATGSRAALTWEDGTQVFLRITDTQGDVTGVATYHAADAEWEVSMSRSIVATAGTCRVSYFRSPASSSSVLVPLTFASTIFIDEAASFEVAEDLLAVRAYLTPKTGRLRFKGNVGQSFTITGLSYYTSYTVATNSYASQTIQLSGTIGSDGYSPFYHVFFTDKKVLTAANNATSRFKVTFANDILSPGTSGYVTLPTVSNPGNWELVNSTNAQPITLPEMGTVELTNVRSTSSAVQFALSSAGNGSISEVGFLYALQENPTLDNGVKVTGTLVDGVVKGTLTGLIPETTYYVRAFATNEQGTAFSTEISFTTNAKPEGSAIDGEDYDGENDWDL